MMNFKEYIVNDIGEKKVLIDLLPKNTPRRKEKYVDTLIEIRDKYQDSKEAVQKYINYKYEKLLPKKVNKSIENEEKELKKINELLILGNPLTTVYEKMGFDILLYDLMHYYDNSLDDVNNTITMFIKKIIDAGGDIRQDDFKINVYSYIYIKNIFDNFINKKISFNNDTFETIYWKCPKVIEYIIINLRIILRKNEKKLTSYISNKYKYKMENLGFNGYDELIQRARNLKRTIDEKQSEDEYDIVNLCLEGKLDINSLLNGKDNDCNFFMIQPIDLAVKKNYDKFIETIKTLKYGLEEYLIYLDFKKILDEFKSKYIKYVNSSEKTTKFTDVKNKYNEIIKLESKIFKLRVNKYASNLKELDSNLKEKDNDKIFNQEILLEELYKKYIELNNLYFDEKIKSNIKVNTYVSDIFTIFDAYPYYTKKLIKKVFELENEKEIDEVCDKITKFVYNPYRKIIDMIPIFVDKKVPQLLMNGYRFENLNVSEESFDDDNISNLFEKCNRIIISDKITKFKLSIDEINFLLNVYELKKKDII